MATQTPSPYDVLGITKAASFDEIKKAYKREALNSHPDKNLDDPEAVKRFQVVKEAYETLQQKNDEKHTAGIEGSSDEVKEALSAQHQIDQAAVEKKLSELLGNDTVHITAIPNPRQSWLTQISSARPDNNSYSLLPVSANEALSVVIPPGKYNVEWPHKSDDGKTTNTSNITLDLTQKEQRIEFDTNDPKSMELGVKTAKACGWPSLAMSNTAPKEAIEATKKLCKENDLPFQLVDTPTPAINSTLNSQKAIKDVPTPTMPRMGAS